VEVSEQMRFSVGDRVRVSDNWFVEEIRGWVGTVAERPAGVPDKRSEGVYWVEFPSLTCGCGPVTTGAEIDASDLIPVHDQ
jgi:hypothetical protein